MCPVRLVGVPALSRRAGFRRGRCQAHAGHAMMIFPCVVGVMVEMSAVELYRPMSLRRDGSVRPSLRFHIMESTA
jgi:hypothetical protein